MVDDIGTRGIVMLSEATGRLIVAYTADTGGNDIVYKESALSSIAFGPRHTLIVGALNNPTSTKQNFTNDLVILASSYPSVATATGVLLAYAGIAVTPEIGGTTSFTVVLNGQPTANVTIPISASDATEGTVSASSLTFTPANWSVPQTVTGTGVDDAD